ncbi:MAG: 2'-5' RNA ligase family protein [Stenomitos frigidus ULC029]
MSQTNDRFFVALLPSQAIHDYANEVKQVFVDRYNSRAALKSPPHITLQPPFEWSMTAYPALSETLKAFAAQFTPIPVALSGFGAFAPRVIYINVIKSPTLLTLQATLAKCLEESLGIVHTESKARSYTPHMTVGFRDLTPENFELAWAEFQQRPLELEFVASHLTLLQHDGHDWKVDAEFPFLDN